MVESQEPGAIDDAFEEINYHGQVELYSYWRGAGCIRALAAALDGSILTKSARQKRETTNVSTQGL
jgi:hypothetical protein